MTRTMLISIALWMGFYLTPGNAEEGGCTPEQALRYTTPPETQERIREIESTEWISLFNGENLNGWFALGNPNAFYVQDGIIECNASGGGWLFSEEQYEDFILELEFKISPGGNSGVCIRAARHGDPAFTGMEVQVLADHGAPPTKHGTGSIYAVITPMLNMSRPAGEWNHFRILCVQRTIRVWMNDIKIIDIDIDQHEALRNRVPTGHVGMQDHGSFVWYRNIRMKTLSKEETTR